MIAQGFSQAVLGEEQIPVPGPHAKLTRISPSFTPTESRANRFIIGITTPSFAGKASPEDGLKPESSGAHPHCLGGLIESVLGELSGPALPALGPAL